MTSNDARLTVEDLGFIIETEIELPAETRDRLARWLLAAPGRGPELRELVRQVRDAGRGPATAEGA